MSVLFIGGVGDDFGGAPTEYTTAGTFDSNYTDRSIGWGNNVAGSAAWTDKTPSGTVWIHFRVRTPSGMTSSGTDGYWMTIYDADGDPVGQLELSNGDVAARVYGGSTVTGTYSWNPSNTTTYTLDLEFAESGGNRTFNVYVDGVLTLTETTTVGSRGLPVRIVLDHFDMSSGTIYYSEFLVRDNDESTLGLRVAKLPGNAAGNYSDGSGDYTNLDEVGITGVELAATEKYSYNLASLGVSPTAIGAVVVKQRASTGGPTQLQNFVRISSTDYTKTAWTIDPAVTQEDVWTTNPATTAAWTESEINALEVGFEAQA